MDLWFSWTLLFGKWLGWFAKTYQRLKSSTKRSPSPYQEWARTPIECTTGFCPSNQHKTSHRRRTARIWQFPLTPLSMKSMRVRRTLLRRRNGSDHSMWMRIWLQRTSWRKWFTWVFTRCRTCFITRVSSWLCSWTCTTSLVGTTQSSSRGMVLPVLSSQRLATLWSTRSTTACKHWAHKPTVLATLNSLDSSSNEVSSLTSYVLYL